MTVPENQWGYQANWSGHVKTSNELIEMMVKSVSLDGNFVLNFGPDKHGTIRPEETKLANEIGNWMSINKNAIYNCGYLNWEKQDWGYYTLNRETGIVNMIVFNIPVSGVYRIKTLNNIEITKAYTLENNTNLNLEKLPNNEYLLNHQQNTYNKPFVIQLKTQETAINKQ